MGNYIVIWVVLILLAFMGAFFIYQFVKQPRDVQITKVKEWLYYAVTIAEREFGPGTGKLKLRYTYDLFVSKFPWVAKVITFEYFSQLVDMALEEMKNSLSNNEDFKLYVEKGVE